VCAAFDALGDDVLAVSSRATSGAMGRIRTARLDLCAAPDRLPQLLRAWPVTAVVNAAGAVWEANRDQMHMSNVVLVQRLVEAVSALPYRPRIVQIGSIYEYGAVPDGTSLDERWVARPTNPYGSTKLRGSQIVLAAATRGVADALVLRLANVTGPGTPPGSLLGQVARQLAVAARAGLPAELRLAPLRARRDFVDARDVALAVTAAMAAPSGCVINIGRGQAVSVRVLVDLLIKASGVPASVVERADGVVSLRAGADWLLVDPATARGADWVLVVAASARTVLGWEARRSLAESMAGLWDAAIAAAAAIPAG
jgi:dTDP-6-deoxy-L-talose 4-dehydrogenase [NAD(P)+]